MKEGEKGSDQVRKEWGEENPIQQQKLMQKQAAIQLADYKKRLHAGVELKRLQVEELQLNIAYHEVRKAWRELQPAIQELNAIERAEIAEIEKQEREKNSIELKDSKKLALNKESIKEIVITKQGKPRDK